MSGPKQMALFCGMVHGVVVQMTTFALFRRDARKSPSLSAVCFDTESPTAAAAPRSKATTGNFTQTVWLW